MRFVEKQSIFIIATVYFRVILSVRLNFYIGNLTERSTDIVVKCI